jgi:hypothetical protein
MNEQVSNYIVVVVLFVVIAIFVLFVALVMDILLAVWRIRKYGQDEDGDWDGGGGGGWTDKPSGRPLGGGGPDCDIDRQFHETANTIGKTIQIEEKNKEKVLT